MRLTGFHKAATRTLLVAAVLTGIMASVLFVAQAASLTNMTLSLSDSGPGVASVSYTFEASASGDSIRGIKFQFCKEASGSCNTPDADFSIAGATLGAGDFATAGWTLATPTADTVTITGATITSDTTISQVIGSITNTGTSGTSSPIVFYAWVTTYSDTGLTASVDGLSVVAAAVIPVISVTGTQDAILEFTVTGATGTVDSGKALSADATATTLPFGNFVPTGISATPGVSRAVAQKINVTTNGVSGYTATIQGSASEAMTHNGAGASIAYVSGGQPWNSNEGVSGTTGFGVASENGHSPGFGSPLSYESIASALTIATNGTAALGVDTTVVFRVQVDASAAAGDYSGNVTYTVLPNF